MLGIIRKEDGAVTVLVAILLVVIIGFSALVIDIGHLYEVRRQLQSAADAAALASAQEIINGGDEIKVSNVAKDYAIKNDFKQDLDTIRELEMVYPSEMTEFTAEYAKVTVKKNVALFLAPVFSLIAAGNFTDKTIYAQAKAEVVYVTGGKGLVPWGVPIVKAGRVEAEVNGEISELLFNSTSGKWEGSLILPDDADNEGYEVSVTYFNSQKTLDFPDGFPETLSPSAYVGIHESDDRISDVYFFPDGYVSPGSSTDLYVKSVEKPSARVGNVNYNNFNLSAGTTDLWVTSVTAPSSVDAITSLPVEVSVGNGANQISFKNAAVLSVRRSTYPVKEVMLGDAHFVVGEANTTFISVELNDFIYGKEYDLKVVAGAEMGNFAALDFRYVFHPLPLPGLEEGENTAAADYYDNIIYYPGEIHIGDIIDTKTGNLSGPTTEKKIDERIAGCNHTLLTWENAIPPRPPCGRVIIIPIVEKIERLNGKSEVVVESIASFFINNYEKLPGDKVNITGQFIEYFLAGEYTTTKPGSKLYLETVRLTTTDF